MVEDQPRTIVITGASSGVGACLARRFAARGDRVYALARTAEALARLEHEAPGRIVGLQVDVRDRAAVHAAIARIEEAGPIDVLINNAAVYDRGPFAGQDPARIDEILDTNIKGTIYPTHAVLPGMQARRCGRIVQINSVAGIRGIVNEAVYCASKHAIVGFSQALMQELVPFNIRVAVVNPGGIDTPLWQREGNCYPGDASTLLQTEDVADVVQLLLDAPDRIHFKQCVFFPTGEWH